MRTLIISLTLALAASALAQADVEPAEDEVRYRKLTAISFTEVDVKGQLAKPESTYFRVRKKTRFRSLIELRSNFAPELERSAASM